ncbi:hypothetical protein B0T24DRAFT_596359 [Lasiosphaeria ovina]|uniref:Uncharacterized protein n=1 Tax=Lasiosphaeria ovina TaxID=92902 RepID=A0AAE0N4A7_9PEZI|nr:hypothetical protein B0T24DRAFT_596359 [Lasiosphaeria ovina]
MSSTGRREMLDNHQSIPHMANAFATIEALRINNDVKYAASQQFNLLDTAKSRTSIEVLTYNQVMALPRIDETSDPPPPTGRVRIVAAKCLQLRTCTNEGGPLPVFIPFRHQTGTWVFPFESEAHLQRLWTAMQLPPGAAARIASTPAMYLTTHFQVYYPPPGTPGGKTAASPPDRLGITLKLPDSAIVGTTASLALSHCHATNTTEALVLCSSDADLDAMLRAVLLAADVAAHPAAVPAIVYSYFRDALEQKIEDTWQETFELETDGGQSGILLARDGSVVTTGNPLLSASRPPVAAARRDEEEESRGSSIPRILMPRVQLSGRGKTQPAAGVPLKMLSPAASTAPTGTAAQSLAAVRARRPKDQAALNQRSIGLAQLALGWENYTQAAVLGIDQVSRFVAEHARTLAASAATTSAQEQQHAAVTEQLRYLAQKAACVNLRSHYLRGRLQVQKDEVNTHRALQLANNSKSIAVASWMEGTAMKYLAVLGLVFLPAACIAAIFTVPDEFLSQYWTTTVLVTLLIMAMCVPATRWKSRSAEHFIGSMA